MGRVSAAEARNVPIHRPRDARGRPSVRRHRPAATPDRKRAVNGVSVRKRRDAVTEGTSRARRRPAIQAARGPQSRCASQAARATVSVLSTIPTQTTTRGCSPATA